ncbi:MAG: hypothetical protein JSR48_00330 [Verrucomicrobia bacterium]|nr:hypothetical protein [Verrucomicrobiota bacterium]
MRLLTLFLVVLGGCATPPVPAPDEVRVNAAVKERYWAIQAGQRVPRGTKVPILMPERVEDGVMRVPRTIELDYP